MNLFKLSATLFFCILFTQLSYSQDVNIPDVNFKSALLTHIPTIDLDGDGEIQVTEAQSFNGILNVASLNIEDLTGIESFTSIVELLCTSNELTTIDLSNNIALQKIDIAANALTILDVSQNINLQELTCNGNNLAELYTYSNPNLEILNVSSNSIYDLDL